MSFTLGKQERLKSKKVIGQLFNKEGQSFAIYPLRVVWLKTTLDSSFPMQFAVSVPKRRFKKAVDRNHLKRQIREAYRLNKLPAYEYLEKKEQQVAFMILYTGKEKIPYIEIEKKMNLLLKRFVHSIKKNG